MSAAFILAFTYLALSVGRVPGLRSDRLAACIIGGVLTVALGVLSLRDAQASVDAPTIGLLFGMMVLSAAVEVSGAFGLAVYRGYFTADLLPPVDRVFAATIAAGTSPELAHALLLWAVPGALVQALGGSSRQMGILLATGLLIVNPIAGWTAAASLMVRGLLMRRWGKDAESPMYIAAGGFIAGSALAGFGVGAWKAR